MPASSMAMRMARACDSPVSSGSVRWNASELMP